MTEAPESQVPETQAPESQATELRVPGPHAMYAADVASHALGITLESATPGRAECTMVVRDTMVNGHGITHGGYVFLLADTCFAMACNDGLVVTVGAGAEITYLAPTRAGDRLVATGREVVTYGRSGIYDVTVHCERAGDSGSVERFVVAEFRGKSRSLPPRK